MSRGPEIAPTDLPLMVRSSEPLPVPSPVIVPESFSSLDSAPEFNLHSTEQRLIRVALARTQQNRTEAARILGISRRTLQRKLKEGPSGS